MKKLLELELKKTQLYRLLENIENKIEEINLEIDHLLEDESMTA
jgi:hypothetical protein